MMKRLRYESGNGADKQMPCTSTRVNVKDGNCVAGAVRTDGTVSDGNQRRRASGAVVRTIKVAGPLSAIRAKCLDCSGGSFLELDECTTTGCPLPSYRSGKRPPTGRPKRPPTPAQLEAWKRMQAARKAGAA